MLRPLYLEKTGLKGINGKDLVYVTFIVNPQIEQLKELYTQVTLNEQAYKDNIILDSFHSATIEGARTTVDNVKRAMSEKPKSKDDKMVVNSINGLTKDESMLLIKMKKRKGAEITVEKCARILEITNASANNLLKGMVDKGYLEKVDNIYKPKV